MEQLQTTTLTVNQPALTFSPTVPGSPSFRIITLRYQQGNEPITLTTDTPEHFQLASDSRPNFAPTLTLIPSSILGTHVHVQYLAHKVGSHTGQLTIKTGDFCKTISLNGRSSHFLPVLKSRRLVGIRSAQKRFRPSVPKLGLSLLTLVMAGALGYVGYNNRCELFPKICQKAVENQAVTPGRESVLSANQPEVALTKKKVIKSKRMKKLLAKATTSTSNDQAGTQSIVNSPDTSQQVVRSRSITSKSSRNKRLTNQRNSDTGDKSNDPSTAESELERELNKI